MDHSVTKALIERKLQTAFQPEVLEVVDESHKHVGHAGVQERGGGHFAVVIVSVTFAGLSRLETHRMVKDALKDEFLQQKIHALRIRARVGTTA